MTGDDKPQRRRRGHGEGSISQRADGRWMARVNLGYVGGKRKRKYIYGATRKEVTDQLKKLLTQQQQGVNIAPERQTVAQFLDRWLADIVTPHERTSTVVKYRQYIELYLKPHIGRVVLSKLSAQQVDTMLASLQQQPGAKAHPLAPGTVRRVRTMLIGALNAAMRYDLVSRNVAQQSITPEAETHEPRVLSFAEAERLLHAAKDDRLYALWLAALLLGLRQGELLGLRWQDIDLEAGVLRVALQLVAENGKLVLTPPKTTRSRRMLPLPAELVTALRQHRVRQLEEQMVVGSAWKDQGFVFTSTIGTPIFAANLRRDWSALLARAELQPMRFHDLRHSCSTFLGALGVDLKTAMEILGHTSAQMTLHYTHALDERKQQAMARLGERFGNKEESA